MSSQKPQICIFTETYHPVIGGGETQALLLAGRLMAAGLPVIVLTRRSSPELAKVERVDEVDVFRLPPAGRGQSNKWGLLFTSLPTLFRLRRKYDLLFVSGFRIIGITSVVAARILNKKVVLKADSQGEWSGEFFRDGLARFRLTPTSPIFRSFIRFRNAFLRRADAFTAITKEISTELTAGGVCVDEIYAIPNSVDTDRFCPTTVEGKQIRRASLGLPEGRKIAIYTGRLVSYKGLPLLLTVWQELLNRHHDAILILLGTGGLDIHNCENELRQTVRDFDLHESVLFPGSVDNVHEYLQAADIFVFPTENDAFPSSLVEAMACGLPVVTTPVGAISEFVTEYQNGLLVEPGNERQLYCAIDKLFSDSGLASRLGLAARETVQERYSSETVGKQYIELFEDLLSTTVPTRLRLDK